MSTSTKIIGIGILASGLGAFLAIVAIVLMANDMRLFEKSSLEELHEFKVYVDDAWSEMRSVTGVRRVRRTSPQYAHPLEEAVEEFQKECNCNQQAVNCPPGPQGARGRPGLSGVPGVDGPNGAPGAPGMDRVVEIFNIETCVKCPRGPQGLPGNDGVEGTPGPDGEPGMDGIPGQVGPVGDPGERGDPGVDEPGPDGAAGVRYMISEKGKRGPRGPPGPQGAPGDTPYVLPGEPGPVGEVGAPGTAGTAGRSGRRGDQGPKGPPGVDAEYCPCPKRAEAVQKEETYVRPSDYVKPVKPPKAQRPKPAGSYNAGTVPAPSEAVEAETPVLGVTYGRLRDQKANQPPRSTYATVTEPPIEELPSEALEQPNISAETGNAEYPKPIFHVGSSEGSYPQSDQGTTEEQAPSEEIPAEKTQEKSIEPSQYRKAEAIEKQPESGAEVIPEEPVNPPPPQPNYTKPSIAIAGPPPSSTYPQLISPPERAFQPPFDARPPNQQRLPNFRARDEYVGRPALPVLRAVYDVPHPNNPDLMVEAIYERPVRRRYRTFAEYVLAH